MPTLPEQIELLNKVRAQDEKPNGKKSPENTSLDSDRLEKFIRDKDSSITAKNFDEKFNVDLALEYLRSKPTRGEAMLERDINAAQQYLITVGLPKLMNEANPESFAAQLHTELVKRGAESREQNLIEAHDKYLLVRTLAMRKFLIKSHFVEQREGEKAGVMETVGDDIKKLVDVVGANFANMDSKEKLLTVGGLLAVTAFLFYKGKDNETVGKIRDFGWGALKMLGIGAVGGLAVNYGYKLFTGKTAWTEIEGWTKKTVARDTFWTDTFKTDSERANSLMNSTVLLGNEKFSDLARRYREAKAAGQTEITLDNKKMKPKEVFSALDAFFSKNENYRVDVLEKKYQDKPNVTWENVVAAQLAEDGSIPIDGDLMNRAKDTVKQAYDQGANWLLAGEGLGVMKWIYKKVKGVPDASDSEVREWTEKFLAKNEVYKVADVPAFIDSHFTPIYVKGYKEAFTAGTTDTKTGVKYKENAGDSIYVAAPITLDNVIGNKKALGNAIKDVEAKAMNFLRERYPEAAPNIYRFAEIEGGVRILENSQFVLFVRMPLKGTREYENKNIGVRTITPEQRRNFDVFGSADKIDYMNLQRYEQERLRMVYYLDSSQTAELQKICKWFTDKYKGQNLTKKYVFDQMFANEADRKQALIETGVTQKLNNNSNLLAQLNKKIDDIEDDAADAIKATGEHNEAIEQMRMAKGYQVRLAILGDADARAKLLGYNPNAPGAQDQLLKDYETWCKKYASNRNAGVGF